MRPQLHPLLEVVPERLDLCAMWQVVAASSMKTPVSYPGGKSRLAPQIVALMPKHRVYVEPFSGTASVLFAKPRARFELINDVDGHVVALLRAIRDQPDELANVLACTPYAREELDDCMARRDSDDPLERARIAAVRIGQSFAKSGLADTKSTWRISTTGGRAESATWADIPDRVRKAAERLRGVAIEQQDAVALIDRYGTDPTALLYVDPPYLAETRTAGMYAHEWGTEAEHRKLAEALRACRAHVLLSGYPSDLYDDDLYSDWFVTDMHASANNNGNLGSIAARVERVWSNREPDAGTLFGEAA